MIWSFPDWIEPAWNFPVFLQNVIFENNIYKKKNILKFYSSSRDQWRLKKSLFSCSSMKSTYMSFKIYIGYIKMTPKYSCFRLKCIINGSSYSSYPVFRFWFMFCWWARLAWLFKPGRYGWTRIYFACLWYLPIAISDKSITHVWSINCRECFSSLYPINQ